jgi:hypothetical protein
VCLGSFHYWKTSKMVSELSLDWSRVWKCRCVIRVGIECMALGDTLVFRFVN